MKPKRLSQIGLKTTDGLRRAVEMVVVEKTRRNGQRCTLSDALDEALRDLAKKYKVEVNDDESRSDHRVERTDKR